MFDNQSHHQLEEEARHDDLVYLTIKFHGTGVVTSLGVPVVRAIVMVRLR